MMTNDEAKTVLFNMLGKGIFVEDTKENQAILAALRALEREPYTDAIIRQAAIVQLSHNKTGDDDCDVIIQKDIETIKALPPVTTRGELPSCEDCMNGNQEEKAKLCQKSYLAGMEHSQEPCEYAISRQAVLDLCERFDGCVPYSVLSNYDMLPPVTPKPKIGHLILFDECSNSGYYCSECQKKVVKEGWSNTVKKIKYCPNCGAKMEEVKE